MKFKRDIVTPYLMFIFFIVGLSGILMFFHLFDDYTNVVHEFLGLALALFAVLHIITNWKSIGNYAKKRKLFIPGIVILIASVSLVIIGKVHGNLEREVLEKLLKSPASISFKILNVDYHHAEAILKQHNIIVKDSLYSIEEISIKNKKSPEEIIELIMN